MKRITSFLTLLLPIILFAQSNQFYQTIRGTVVDQITKSPLVSANVIIADSNPLLGTSTDANGHFRIEKVSVGRVTVKVGYIGYHPAILRNILVYPAKEVVLDIELEQSVLEMEEISVQTTLDFMPLNDMATVSARRFSVEETEKYAGSRGDVARMASNYAGVSFSSDDRNDIVIRGNTPAFLLWRLEGVEIPNPNHFAMEGTSGGPVGMLNNNTLSNSDFFTGAFPAEYGNALSGVFDLSMRSGNNEKFEFLGQIGFNGFELGMEGPISKSNGSSILANYRYSTLDLMDKMGMDFGTVGVPKYQDFTSKVTWPTKSGRLEMFSLWGTSEIAILDSNEGKDDFYKEGGVDLYNGSTVGAGGLNYLFFHNQNTISKLSVSGFYQRTATDIYELVENGSYLDVDDNYKEKKASAQYRFTRKFNTKISTQTGISVDRMGYNLNGRYFDEDENKFFPYFDNNLTVAEGPNYLRAHSQWKYKFTNNVALNTGLHFSYFDLNKSKSVEPRLGMTFNISPTQEFSVAYGLHSRLQQLITYYFIDMEPGKIPVETNLDLGFTKAHHFVVGFDQRLTENTRLKIEGYYQHLFDVPVELVPSSYSILNTGSQFAIDLKENLVNRGTGKNYGLELTLERFYSNGLYFLATGSLFDSKYRASDGVLRNTLFDNDFVTNVLAGKEFRFSAKNTIFFDVKLSYAGGKRYTPINLDKSRYEREVNFFDHLAFSEQHPNYLKLDFKIGYRKSSARITQEWQFYVENATNRKNVFAQRYNADKEEIETVYQLGLFPMINYRIYF